METRTTATAGTPRVDFTPLRQLRESRGWSQKELARKAGMHHATVNRIEKNLTEPPLSKVFRLSRALGVPHDQLFSVAV